MILFVGAFLVACFKGKLQKIVLLLFPILAAVSFFSLTEGTHWSLSILHFDLVFGRVDKLSMIFVSVFTLTTVIAVIYNLNSDNRLEHFASLLYAGAAIGVTLAGDLITFFIFWETLTLGSIFLVLSARKGSSIGAALRYLLVHVVGGLILLSGIVLYMVQHKTISFSHIGLSDTASYLIFIGFGVNCAWPFLHAWLPDAYPEATIGGVIFMATFTTKTAVYALMRGFPGEHSLIWIGVLMATFPIFYAVIENDLRRVLAYSLINQVGFMVVGIGIGTELSMNGTAAHVYADIIFKGLLFMSIGAVMFRTGGKAKATELGGLFRSMPLTGVFCMVGAASISAFPFFSGFATKSMIMSAAAEHNLFIPWVALLFASAGVFHHAGIKIPFFTFFSHDSGIRVKEAPINMLIAMGVSAILCVGIGTFPQHTLYKMLPFAMEHGYEPYSFAHVNAQTMLLLFSALAFTLLLMSGIYPSEIRSVNIDADWIYRKGSKLLYRITDSGLNGLNRATAGIVLNGITRKTTSFAQRICYSFSSFFLRLIWKIKGEDRLSIQEKTRLFEIEYKLGVLPVGFAMSLILAIFALLSAVAIIRF